MAKADDVDTVKETKKLKADLIILGSHHHSALYNLLVGCMTGREYTLRWQKRTVA